MIYQSVYEKQLVEEGFNSLSLDQKNNLVATLAGRNGLLFSQVTDDYILQTAKDLKTELFNETCEQKIIGGFESASTGHTIRLNRDDQINMIGEKDLIATDSTILSVDWLTLDAGYQTFTTGQFLTIYTEGLQHKKAVILQYNQLKAEVQACTNHDDLLKIQWT